MNTQPTPGDQPFRNKEAFTPSIQELEGHFQHLYDALGEVAEALSTHAAIAHYAEQQFEALAEVAREGLQLVQDITSGAAITPLWLAQRDRFVIRVLRLINGDQPSAENTEGRATEL